MTQHSFDGTQRSVLVAADTDSLAQRGAAIVDAWACEDIAANGVCHIGLTGGTTPVALYRHWAARHRADPARLALYHGDERCVPKDHADSNHRAAYEALIGPMGVPCENERIMDGAALDRADAARRYAELLPPRFDVLLLGMGPDGHTASLFPGDSAALRERARLVVHVVGSKPPPNRLTITRTVIERARRVLMLVSGAAKAEAVARALAAVVDVAVCPAALAAERAWLIDAAAAALLPASTPRTTDHH